MPKMNITKTQSRKSVIPRPLNSFMIFRMEHQASVSKEYPGATHQDISKKLSMKWKELTAEERQEYYTKALAAKEEHKLQWVFRCLRYVLVPYWLTCHIDTLITNIALVEDVKHQKRSRNQTTVVSLQCRLSHQVEISILKFDRLIVQTNSYTYCQTLRSSTHCKQWISLLIWPMRWMMILWRLQLALIIYFCAQHWVNLPTKTHQLRHLHSQ